MSLRSAFNEKSSELVRLAKVLTDKIRKEGVTIVLEQKYDFLSVFATNSMKEEVSSLLTDHTSYLEEDVISKKLPDRLLLVTFVLTGSIKKMPAVNHYVNVRFSMEKPDETKECPETAMFPCFEVTLDRGAGENVVFYDCIPYADLPKAEDFDSIVSGGDIPSRVIDYFIEIIGRYEYAVMQAVRIQKQIMKYPFEHQDTRPIKEI